MAKDCYPRFLRSQAYGDLVCQAKPSATATKKPWTLSIIRWSVLSWSPSMVEKAKLNVRYCTMKLVSGTETSDCARSSRKWPCSVDARRLKRKGNRWIPWVNCCVNTDEVWTLQFNNGTTDWVPIKQEERNKALLFAMNRCLWLWCAMFLS